jgi:Flp pilus assembly protein TadG
MSRAKIVSKKKGERGNYAIEFGLCFVLFFSVLLGILDVTRGIYAYSFLAGAAKEGSRYAMVHGSSTGSKASSSDVQGVVQKWLIGMVDPTSATVTTSWNPPSGNPGSLVTVNVQYTYTPITSFLVGAWTLKSTSQTMVIQ